MAASPTAVTFVDYLNEYGLVLIGLGLLIGLLTRAAMVSGIVLLALYYVVAPPLPGYVYLAPAEGSYIVVNKVLIEAVALLVLLAFPASRHYTLDVLLRGMRGTAIRSVTGMGCVMGTATSTSADYSKYSSSK